MKEKYKIYRTNQSIYIYIYIDIKCSKNILKIKELKSQ